MKRNYPRLLKNVLVIAVLFSCVLSQSGCSYFGFYTRKAHWQKTFDGYRPCRS